MVNGLAYAALVSPVQTRATTWPLNSGASASDQFGSHDVAQSGHVVALTLPDQVCRTNSANSSAFADQSSAASRVRAER
jgi:hypothetical protein